MDPLATRIRHERERQGLTIRDVAVVTKIREPYIEAIERGRYDVLPAVYVKSFVKTLLSSLGVNDDEIRQLMSKVFDSSEDATRLSSYSAETSNTGLEETFTRASEAVSSTVVKASEAVGTSLKKIRSLQPPPFLADRPRFIMVAAMIAALVVVAVFIWLLSSNGEEDVKGAEAVQEEISTEVTVPTTGSSAAAADSMRLTADVVDTAWLTITMDGAHTRQQVLAPGEDYAWFAKNKFVLNISNAGGVRFYRDGEALPFFGRQGETVRSVTITRTDVISSASPAGGLSPSTTTQNAPTSTRTVAPKPAAQVQPKPAPAQPRQRAAVRQRPRANRQPPQRRSQPSQTRRSTRSIPMITPAPVRPPR